MRAPMEKALASIGTPGASSISNGVARAVARGEHERGAVLHIFKPPGDNAHALHRAAVEHQPLQPGAEAHLAAEGDDLLRVWTSPRA